MRGACWPKEPCTGRDTSTAPKSAPCVFGTVGEKAFLTIKGITVGATRRNTNMRFHFDDCQRPVDNLAEKPLIEKKRYKIKQGEFTWEIDEFLATTKALLLPCTDCP